MKQNNFKRCLVNRKFICLNYENPFLDLSQKANLSLNPSDFHMLLYMGEELTAVSRMGEGTCVKCRGRPGPLFGANTLTFMLNCGNEGKHPKDWHIGKSETSGRGKSGKNSKN